MEAFRGEDVMQRTDAHQQSHNSTGKGPLHSQESKDSKMAWSELMELEGMEPANLRSYGWTAGS